MAKISTLTLKGVSGTEYSFDVYPSDQSFRAVGGVYIISRRYQNVSGGFSHDIIYVGETGDFSERFDDHHKAPCFARNNFNCICTLVKEDSSSRLIIEKDLIGQWKPSCND